MSSLRTIGLALAVASVVLLGDRGVEAQPPEGSSSKSEKGRSPELDAAVRALVRDHTLKDAQIGIVLMDAESGAILAQHGEHTVLNPASNAKLYTAAAALGLLHGSHRYQTTISGTIKGGGLSGLVLRGHGDPSLRSQDLWAMVQELKAHGARRIEGDIHVDQKFFDEQTTPPAFEQQPNEWAAFRAPVSAVALNGNTVTLAVRPTKSGESAIAFFDPPGFVYVEGTVKTGDEGADTVGLELTPNGKRLSAKLSGSVGQDAKLVRYTRRVDDPRLLAGYALKAILEEAGLKGAEGVKLGEGGKGGVLARHESDPLSQLLYALGKNSDNFYAEMIFKSIAPEVKSRPGKSQDSAELVKDWVEKHELSDTGVVIKNGSGLFDSNRTTAYSMARLLRFAWQDTALKNEFVAQLSIGGVDGTLHKRFRDTRHERSIRAKTGTLDDAIALSGYVLGPPGKGNVCFAIVFNKVSGHAAAARAAADKLVDLVHDQRWKKD